MINEDNSDPSNIVMVHSQESSQKSVKSTAIVKYSAASTPANFARLQCNTDLNSPPSNWLSNSADSYGLQHVLFNSTGFTSFRMAHMFPDCVGEVDVVSDAENIKNLLKLPYSRGPVSMMVHRIENTLLIDEFDIHKYLLRSAETEWAWLKKFFIENIQQAWSEKDLDLYGKSKRRDVLQQKSLMSKFLYHSLVESKVPTSSTKEDETPTSLPFPGPALPEPSLEEEVPDSTSKHKYNRNVVWTFEDIQMLIGTDMPIFGGSTHPCISLRLRDMNKPISVLTGIDYWLDNLMSNVPEVVMCYHLNGIVQKYEFIKTEDLPHLKDSKFSPKLIRDIAQNILSFLKSNATKAGHTYWLFKGRNDDVVKLYDLTSLCSGVLDEKGQNPFTVPVAMLLYRVARNMKHSSDGPSQSGTIKMLLKNCIELLSKEKYPQIVTSSYYMLSDLYVPADTNPTNPGIESESQKEFENNENLEEESCVRSNNNDYIKQLRLNEAFDQDSEGYKYEIPFPINGTIIERCLVALQYLAAGINCLQYFPSQVPETKENNANEDTKQQLESDNLNMAKPFEAIPMPYSPINEKNVDVKKKGKKKNKNEKKTKKSTNENPVETPRALLPKPKAEAMPTWQEPDRSDDASWYTHLKTLLYEKSCLVYAILAEQEFLYENYGTSLHYINVLVKCQKILKNLHFSSQHVQESCLLGRAGDCCCMIEKNWTKIEEYREQYNTNTNAEIKMLEEINKDLPNENREYENWSDLLPNKIENNEQMLLISCRCYERALSAEPGDEKTNLLRRLGNVQNELGSFYMNQVCVILNESSETNDVETLISKSLYYLETGIRTFESIDDKINLALLHSNMGRLMRLCAHLNSGKVSDKLSEIVGQEKIYYNKALASYQKARQILVNRNTNPEIWDAITWELSTASYNMATLLQDYPTLGSRTTKQLEQEVVELLHKALEFCDMETPSYRQPIHQFRGAKIHHRLASLYHNSFRKMSLNDARRKSVLMLCKLHYERAGSILLLLEDSTEYLNVQLEYLAFYLLLFQNATSLPLKYKHLILGLNVLLSTTSIINTMKEKNLDSPEKITPSETRSKNEQEPDKVNSEAEDKDMKLLKLIETQLQFILLNLTKLFAKPTKNITNDHCSTYGGSYKQLYGLALRVGLNQSKDRKTYISELAKTLEQVENEISKLPELNL